MKTRIVNNFLAIAALTVLPAAIGSASPTNDVAAPVIGKATAVTTAQLRQLAIQQVNEHWLIERSKVENETTLSQKIPVRWPEDRGNGTLNLFCIISPTQPRPDFFVLRFQRRGATRRWDDYRRIAVNVGGKIVEYTPKECRSNYDDGDYLEQMVMTLTAAQFYTWAKQETIPLSIAGEEITLTHATLNKWRALVSYLALSEPPQPAQTNSLVAKPKP